jgi:hypothetical protein
VARTDNSGLEITIKSVKLEYVKLRKTSGDTSEESMSKEKVLIFTLVITNKGQKEVTYKTFNGAPGGKNDYASLIDNKRKFVTLADFGDLEPEGITRTATLKPGESIMDVLCFGKPENGAKPVTLLLPAKNHGGKGLWRLDVKVEPVPE